MNLIRLLKLIGGNPLRKLLAFASASALSTTLVLSVVTFAAQQIDKTKEEFVNVEEILLQCPQREFSPVQMFSWILS